MDMNDDPEMRSLINYLAQDADVSSPSLSPPPGSIMGSAFSPSPRPPSDDSWEVHNDQDWMDDGNDSDSDDDALVAAARAALAAAAPDNRVSATTDIMANCEFVEVGCTSEIVKNLQCPVCQGFPIPPLWLCKAGHVTCDQCKARLERCGLCRKSFTSGRNIFMESVVNDCTVTCPFTTAGCKEKTKVQLMKSHITDCDFGPKIKWVTCKDGNVPPNAVEGGLERGVKLYVMRAMHSGALTPGKCFAEFSTNGISPSFPTASVSWDGAEHFMTGYEILTANLDEVKWIPSKNGEILPNAVLGGTSESRHENLFIGRFNHEGHLICGKIHPSHNCCFVAFGGKEIRSTTYEVLVQVPRNREAVRNNIENETESPVRPQVIDVLDSDIELE